MPVITRVALEESPLADLHQLASELSLDGFRRLRREELIDAILERQGGEKKTRSRRRKSEEVEENAEPKAATPRPRRRKAAEPEKAAESEDAPRDEAAEAALEGEEEEAPPRRRSRRTRAGARAAAEEPAERVESPEAEEPLRAGEEGETVDGVVELLPNGSGFVRVNPPEPSDEDVYISAAQVKRCELVTGDRVSGPRRAPRRSERFASLVRVETVNGRPAAELADSVRYDDLPAALPRQRIALAAEDPTLKAIEWLTPFGRGSRVTLVGPARAGKTEALRLLSDALRKIEDLQVSVVLAGARPEEISELSRADQPPAAALSLAASADAQANAVELVVDQGRRIAARGGHAVVLIDTLDGLSQPVARRIMASARNLVEGGSLTLIATASESIGGETTVIALDAVLTATRRFPALDLVRSGTLRADLLVGEAGAEAIARARSEALDQ